MRQQHVFVVICLFLSSWHRNSNQQCDQEAEVSQEEHSHQQSINSDLTKHSISHKASFLCYIYFFRFVSSLFCLTICDPGDVVEVSVMQKQIVKYPMAILKPGNSRHTHVGNPLVVSPGNHFQATWSCVQHFQFSPQTDTKTTTTTIIQHHYCRCLI